MLFDSSIRKELARSFGAPLVVLVTVVAWAWLGQQLDAAALLGIGMITSGVIIIQGFSKTTHA